jgi:hypothetical protein
MKKNLLILSIVLGQFTAIFGQENEIPKDFTIVPVNKKVKEFPDEFDNSSPLSSRITVSYIWINGTVNKYRDLRPERSRFFDPSADTPNEQVSEKRKSKNLNSTILEVIMYHDSISGIITQYSDSAFSIEYFEKTNNKWWYLGGDPYNSFSDCRKQFLKYAGSFLSELHRAEITAIVPKDTVQFIDYLKNKAYNPKEFLIKKLKEHKLVMYGEIHRRKASWDFCRQVINDKQFPKDVGTVFMEMASHKQSDIDKFLTSDTLNKELILDVFREYILFGWIDKGMFDFVVDIRKINQNLPKNKGIRIIAVDTPRPFSTFNSKEDMKKNDALYDRNEFMAKTILNCLKTSPDKRHAFFIVGTAHICKTLNSAGNKISNSLPKNDTYAFFTHSPVTDNFMDIPLRIRHGVFDYAFKKAGNSPLAFDLKNSPFGNEPFDAFYSEGSGSFQDNYDGYIYLGPLDSEPNGELLLDLYSDKFIKELNRRLGFFNTTIEKELNIKDSSKESVIESTLKGYSLKKWDYLPPLKNTDFDKKPK